MQRDLLLDVWNNGLPGENPNGKDKDLKILEKAFEAGITLRAVALMTNVNKMIAYLWRRKAHASLEKVQDSTKLSGSIQIDKTYVRVWKKDRIPGFGGRMKKEISVNQMAIGVGYSENEKRFSLGLIAKGHPTSEEIDQFWGNKIVEGSTIIHDNFNSYATLITHLKLNSQIFPTMDKHDNLKALQKVNNACSYIKRYLYCYLGITAKNLPHYLAYFQRHRDQIGLDIRDRWKANLQKYVMKTSYSTRKALYGS